MPFSPRIEKLSTFWHLASIWRCPLYCRCWRKAIPKYNVTATSKARLTPGFAEKCRDGQRQRRWKSTPENPGRDDGGAARRRGGWASINRNAGRTGDDVRHRHRRPTHRCRGCSEECLGKARPNSPPCNERVGTGSDRRRTCRKNHSTELAQPHCDFETASAGEEGQSLPLETKLGI